MARKFRRNCDQCGQYYEGFGAKYCSHECADNAKRGLERPHDLPPRPDESVLVDLEDDAGVVYVAASQQIRTPEELFAKSGLDPDLWEIANNPPPKMRTWSVPMKVEDQPHVIQLHYVAISVRKRLDTTFEFRPIVVNINTKATRARSEGLGDVSIHYGDLHIPFHDERAQRILLAVCDIVRPKWVIDHGDTIDAQELGKYSRDPYNVITLQQEIQTAAEWFGQLTDATPDAEHTWIEGNHEERKRRVVWAEAERKQMGSLLTLDSVREALEWKSLLGLDSLGWSVVPYPQHVVFHDKLILTHGSVVRQDSAMSARAEYKKYGKSGISGHTHRIGHYHHRDYNGTKAWFEIGMMGRVRDDYTVFPNWQQGFGVVSWSPDRQRWSMEQVAIHDGTAFFRGMRLEG